MLTRRKTKVMLPKNIIGTYRDLVQKICIPSVRCGQRRQFLFGLNTLSARPFVSLNSNARTTCLSRSAAESKMARLLRNPRLQPQIAKLNLKLSGVEPTSLVNVDHSEFNGLSVLMFAMQTYAGRALPVYLETMPSLAQGHKTNSKEYLRAKARYTDWKQRTGCDQYSYTIRCIGELAKQLGFVPRLVFDRGFCNKRILKYLKRNRITCYVRTRSWLRVTIGGTRKQISDLEPGSYIVNYGCKLRLIVGDRHNEHTEPWYIFTTDLVSTTANIIKIYYHRFEIEELFRDMKSLLRTKGSRLKKPMNLATLLGYVCLGILLLYLVRTKLSARSSVAPHIHTKKRLSGFRILFEQLEKELRSTIYFGSSNSYG